jgi:c-di-GMP-binding flagellar brake protein YcgR
MYDLQERRRFVRLNALVDVAYSKKAVPALEKEKLSVAKNISKGGICLIVYEPIKAEDVLDLKVYLPDRTTPIDVVGKVVWTKEFILGDIPGNKRYDVGIEFLNVNQKELSEINKYVFTSK